LITRGEALTMSSSETSGDIQRSKGFFSYGENTLIDGPSGGLKQKVGFPEVERSHESFD